MAGPTKAKYRTAEHRAERARWKPVVDRGEAWCAQPVCLMPSRWIPPGSRWHLGHDETGTLYIGPVHELCNVTDGGRRRHMKHVRRRVL